MLSMLRIAKSLLSLVKYTCGECSKRAYLFKSSPGGTGFCCRDFKITVRGLLSWLLPLEKHHFIVKCGVNDDSLAGWDNGVGGVWDSYQRITFFVQYILASVCEGVARHRVAYKIASGQVPIFGIIGEIDSCWFRASHSLAFEQ